MEPVGGIRFHEPRLLAAALIHPARELKLQPAHERDLLLQSENRHVRLGVGRIRIVDVDAVEKLCALHLVGLVQAGRDRSAGLAVDRARQTRRTEAVVARKISAARDGEIARRQPPRRAGDPRARRGDALRGIGAGDRGDILIVERRDAVIDGPRIDERIVTPRRHRGRKRRRGRRSVDRPREVSPAAVGVRLAVVRIQQHAPTRDGLAAQRHVELVPLLRAAPALVERGDLRIVEPHRHQLAKGVHRRCRRDVDLAGVGARAEAFCEIVLVIGLQVPAAGQVDLHAGANRRRVGKNADVVAVHTVGRSGHRRVDHALPREKRRDSLATAVAGRHRRRHRRARAEEARRRRDDATDHDVGRHRLRRDVGRARDLRRIARRNFCEVPLLIFPALGFVHWDRLGRLGRHPHREPIADRLTRKK